MVAATFCLPLTPVFPQLASSCCAIYITWFPWHRLCIPWFPPFRPSRPGFSQHTKISFNQVGLRSISTTAFFFFSSEPSGLFHAPRAEIGLSCPLFCPSLSFQIYISREWNHPRSALSFRSACANFLPPVSLSFSGPPVPFCCPLKQSWEPAKFLEPLPALFL